MQIYEEKLDNQSYVYDNNSMMSLESYFVGEMIEIRLIFLW